MAKFKPNRRQVITILSVLYLLTLTILAAYALHLSNYYSLPIPNVHSALTVALPPLAGIALSLLTSFQTHLTTKPHLQYSKIFQSITAFFLIYETVLATLAGTHISPLGGLWCPLHDKWTEMFRAKDSEHIARIQDAFTCCGFNEVRDMAYPFPDRNHGSDACILRYERDQSCLEPWRDMERKVAILLLVVPVGVFVWKVVLFVLVGGAGEGWLPSAIRLPRDGEVGGNSGEVRVRPAITFRDVEEEGEVDSLREEVTRLNQDSSLASHVVGNSSKSRVRPSPLIQEQGVGEGVWARD